jgi:hypothetical protein
MATFAITLHRPDDDTVARQRAETGLHDDNPEQPDVHLYIDLENNTAHLTDPADCPEGFEQIDLGVNDAIAIRGVLGWVANVGERSARATNETRVPALAITPTVEMF